MLNIRANTPEEFIAALHGFEQHVAALCAQVAASVKAEYAVIRETGATVIERDRHNGSQSQQNASQQPNNGGWGNRPQGQQNGPQNGYQGQQQQPDNGGIPTSPPPHVGPAPSCSHGVKNFIAKPYKNGKQGYWMAWACPAQRGDNSQHELEFIDQKQGR